MMNGHGQPTQVDKIRALLDQLERWQTTMMKSMHHGEDTYTFDDIVNGILANRFLFFSYPEHFFLMEKVTYPQYSVFHCFLAGGSLPSILRHIPEMERLGKELGCKKLSLAGRKGWERTLMEFGWKHICTTLYLDLEDKPDEQQGRAADDDGRAARRN